jgi:hypothetical protein
LIVDRRIAVLGLIIALRMGVEIFFGLWKAKKIGAYGLADASADERPNTNML